MVMVMSMQRGLGSWQLGRRRRRRCGCGAALEHPVRRELLAETLGVVVAEAGTRRTGELADEHAIAERVEVDPHELERRGQLLSHLEQPRQHERRWLGWVAWQARARRQQRPVRT